MKKELSTLLFAISISAFSQVGINSIEPKATLDVMANAIDNSKADGIIAPRLKGTELKSKDDVYTADQKGTLVYVTEILPLADRTAKTINLTEVGYFYFDGTVWKSFEDDTLEDVVTRGNYSPKFITFIDQTTGKLGVNPTLHNYYFGNQNTNATGLHNLSFGFNSLLSLTKGVANVGLGGYSLQENTVGGYNTAVGGSTLQLNTIGTYNTAVGINSLKNNAISSYNTAIGSSALNKNLLYGKNAVVGASAFINSTSIGNSVGVGFGAGWASNGLYNTNLGYSAGGHNGNGNWNIYLGAMAGGAKVGTTGTGTGKGSIYIGASSGSGVNGNNNLFIGTESGFAPGVTNTITVNNRLVINGSYTRTGDDENETGVVNNGNTIENGLIIGDFQERWVKFNGKLYVNPSLISTSTPAHTKSLVFNPTTGDVAISDSTIPTPPTSGSYVLKSVNGVTQWVTD